MSESQSVQPEPGTGAGMPRRRFLQLAGGALALASAGPLAAACGEGSAPAAGGGGKGPVSLFMGKNTAHPQAQTTLIDMIRQEFAKLRPGVELTYDTYASSSEELTKLETAAASKEGPDIFEFGSTLIPTAMATGAFEILGDAQWQRLGGKDAFFKPHLAMSGPSPDRTIGVPEVANPYAMIYNRRLFQEAGISGPPRTWNEFVDYGQRLTNPARDQWGVAMAPADGFEPWHLVWLFTTQLGGQMVDVKQKKGLLDSPEVLKATAFWLDWMGRFKLASPVCATYKQVDQVRAFAAGKAAMLIMVGPATMITLNQSPVANDYAFAPNPTIPYGMSSLPPGGKPAQGFVSGQFLTIFKHSKNREAALDVVKVMTSPEIQYQFFKLYGSMPVSLETYKRYPETKASPWDVLLAGEEHAYPTPFFGAWGQLQVAVGKAVNRLAGQIATAGGYSPDDLRRSMAQANAELEQAIRSGS